MDKKQLPANVGQLPGVCGQLYFEDDGVNLAKNSCAELSGNCPMEKNSCPTAAGNCPATKMNCLTGKNDGLEWLGNCPGAAVNGF